MSTTRRDLIKAGAAGAVGVAAGLSMGGAFARRAFAAPEREIAVKPTLVVLFLRGGQDSLNVMVPYADPRYYEMRPNIAIPTPDKEDGAIKLDATFGFHPALTGFKKLWDDGLLAPIVNCGSHNPSRSHFDCQDFMDFGAPGDKTVHEGWLNRFLTATSPNGPEGEFRALAMQGRLPRSLRGKYPVLAVPENITFARPDENVLDLFDDLYKAPPSMGGPNEMGTRPDEDALTENGRTTIATLRKLEEIVTRRAAGNEVKYPVGAGRLGQQLMKTARVLKSGQGVEVVAMDWNGWDHHINEGGPTRQDTIWRMLDQLGTACATFMEDVKDMRSKVTLLVMTEFGRTNNENGNRGTDHGHGSTMFAMGGSVKGGKVYGDWTGLDEGKTYQARDLLVTTDFRQVFAESMFDFMKLHPSKNLFPKFTPAETKLGLFGA